MAKKKAEIAKQHEADEPIYSGLSKKAQHLLSKDEGFDVDFKRGMSGFDVDSIVAFANSVSGGAILIGVEEFKNEKGEQRGRIVGCEISDDNRLSINNKAGQCIPPVSLTIHVENNDGIPFYRVEIPSSFNKPHCTSGGTYKIRKDNQKWTLGPIELLQLFLEHEGGDFIKRFKQATHELHKDIFDQNNKLAEFISSSTLDLEINTQSMIDNLNQEIGDTIQEVKSQTEILEAQTKDFLEELQQETAEIKEQLEFGELKRTLDDINYKLTRSAWKTNRILEHLGLEDPEVEYERNNFRGYLQAAKNLFGKRAIDVDNTFLKDMYDRSNPIIRERYSVEDIRKWYDEMSVSEL